MNIPKNKQSLLQEHKEGLVDIMTKEAETPMMYLVAAGFAEIIHCMDNSLTVTNRRIIRKHCKNPMVLLWIDKRLKDFKEHLEESRQEGDIEVEFAFLITEINGLYFLGIQKNYTEQLKAIAEELKDPKYSELNEFATVTLRTMDDLKSDNFSLELLRVVANNKSEPFLMRMFNSLVEWVT